ncbi:3-hydroxyacyl-[acyl-carrier-protein] dehydratase [Lachnotalea glycerini]|uniref:3-hydroxyacyl-[acyl-carrier-protein] dehydratase n=1 Tax=Lachnotalea glycerini TaxID=1763509 RepID=A0A318EUH8_9FIRM|nr:3-hydroxyacyl-ACP dehydratase FabZ [Lachnotalea glycerini]PXV93250.1 3-hydroxyacyl-[acyl-carrier-protein] dehydratase [Lachnotalea glycerini]
MKCIINASQIMKILPHKYPFLLLDGILEIEKGKKIIGIKNVTVNEPYFQGHFPDEMVVPGVLIIESLAQLTAVLYCLENIDDMKKISECDLSSVSSKVGYLVSVEHFKFINKVYPGEQMILKSELKESFVNLLKLHVEAAIEEKIVARGEILVTRKMIDS